MREAAWLLYDNEKAVYSRVRAGSIKSKKIGGKRYIHESEIERQRNNFYVNNATKFPWPVYTSKEAAEKLGCHQSAILALAREKCVDAIRIKQRWYFRKEHIDWGYGKLRKGYIKIRWARMRFELYNEIKCAPWPAYDTNKAAKILGMAGDNSVSAVIRSGNIPAIKYKQKWYVPKILVDTLLHLRKSGKRIYWKTAVKHLKNKYGDDWYFQ